MLLIARQRSQLFSQLATLEHAGIAPAQAFAMIGRDFPSGARQALAQTVARLTQGMAIAEAGEGSGMLLPWEARLVCAAALSGRLEPVYQGLSEYYAGRARRFGQLKARLVFPFLILTLATSVAPFPALFQGAMGLGDYLLRAVGPLLLLYGSLRLLVFAYRQQLARETGIAWAGLLRSGPPG